MALAPLTAAAASFRGAVTALLIGALFAACVLSSGYGLLRVTRLTNAAIGFGLAPAAGLAVLIVASVWISFVGLPPVAATVLIGIGVVLGVAMALRDRHRLYRAFIAGGEARLTLLLVVLCVAVPTIVLGAAFNAVVVPLSSDDGAHHVEIINQLRQGGQWAGWYPRGFHSLVAGRPPRRVGLGALRERPG